jgi:RNA polymerase sigma factor (sigma-70 family)
VTAAQAGDPTATADLVERFRPLLLSLCRGQPEREDLFQEAVCQLLELVRDYDPSLGVYFGHYLKTKLSWRLRNYRRAARRITRAELPWPEDDDPSWVTLATDSDHLALRLALRQLSARQRLVVLRSYWEDQHAEPIARELGISARAVRALRQRAERRLAALLAPEPQCEAS